MFNFGTLNFSSSVPPTYVWSAWNMDAASGANEPNAITASGSSYNLTNVGTVGTTAGKISGARNSFGPNFNSPANYLKWPASGSQTTPFDIGGFSWFVDGWFNTSDSTNDECIIGKIFTTSGDNAGWEVLVSAGHLKLRIGQNGSTASFTSTNSVATGSWVYFLVGNIQGNGSDSVRFYINGVHDTGVSGSYTMQGSGWTGDLGIGACDFNSGWGNGFDGAIDALAFYSGRQTTLPSSWTTVETAIIAPRYNSGAGAQY